MLGYHSRETFEAPRCVSMNVFTYRLQPNGQGEKDGPCSNPPPDACSLLSFCETCKSTHFFVRLEHALVVWPVCIETFLHVEPLIVQFEHTVVYAVIFFAYFKYQQLITIIRWKMEIFGYARVAGVNDCPMLQRQRN